MIEYEIITRIPTAKEHRAMFEAVGWHPYTMEETENALARSLFGVVAVNDDKVIGMGRVIGDGGKFFYIQDFAIHPDFQRKGIGRVMMQHMMTYIKENAPHEPFVGLFATEGAIPFYAEFDFAPHTEVLTGMWTVLPRLNGGTNV